MRLYKISIANGMDDTLQTEIVLSNINLNLKENQSISFLENYAGIKIYEDHGEYLHKVETVTPIIVADTSEDFDQLTNFVNKLK